MAVTRRALADAIYRALLRAFPRDVRRAAGAGMQHQFQAERELVRGRPLAIVRLWARAAADAIWHGTLERLAIRAPVTAAPRYMHMSDDHRLSWPPASGGAGVWRGTWRDVGWSARRLRANPGFAAVAALTLALGIGATTAIFSVVYGVLLQPLPFPDAGRIVGLFQVWEGKRDNFTAPSFLDAQARAKSFTAAAAYTTHGVTLTNAGEAARLVDTEVTAGFFDVLQTPPLLGRTLTRADNEPGHAAVIVLGYGLWQSRFGAKPDVVGATVVLDGRPRTVVGVMPRGFVWPLDAECWEPAEYTSRYTKESRGAWYLDAIGRLAPGVTVEQAAAEMGRIGRQLETEYPDFNARVGMTACPLVDAMLGDTKRALLVLLAAVGFVLLIACVNVANLALARAATRENELAVRVALGAGRWRLVRQVLVESLMLASLGGGAGLVLAATGLRVLQAVRPPGIPRLDAVGLDPAMLGVTAGVTVMTALLFGAVPAMQTSRRSLADVLRERGRSALGGVRGRATRYALIVGELALAVLLLIGAGLLVRSFAQLLHVNPGFEVGQAVTFRLGLPETAYKDDAARLAFYDRMRAGLAALPGVTAVGAVSVLPPSPPSFNLSFEVAGRPKVAPNDQPAMEIRIADAAYFRTMQIPVRRGRLFSEDDRSGTTPVLVITESAARRHFANEDPIGRHIAIGWSRNGKRVEGDVVGVAADVKSFGVEHEAPPQVYLPLSQVPAASMSFVVRTASAPESSIASVRNAVRQVDPNLPLARVETLAARIDGAMAERRFYMLLLALFGAIALALAGVGVFGVLSFLVAQRTREIGIRVALGARRESLVALILGQALVLSLAGVALGTAGGLGLTRLMTTMLFEMSPTDPATFALVDAGLVTVALLAAWVPARRATRVDPTVALRAD